MSTRAEHDPTVGIRPVPATSDAPADVENGRPRHHDAPPESWAWRLLRSAPVVLALVAITYGVILRIWLLVHLPLFGDEAVVGLMARQIDAGHFTAFYWGQRYGGVEPYVAALLLRVGGGGPTALNLASALLSALAAVLVAAIVRAAGTDRRLALVAGAVAWVWPYVVVWNSVRELGFRYAALCCGLAALLFAVRAQRGKGGLFSFALLGVALGLGWWASPEILYFVPPCLVLLVGWWRSGGTRTSLPDGMRAIAITGAGALVGSLPWWYANLGSDFASLRSAALPAGSGLSYGSRLSVFFHKTLPINLGVRTVPGGAWAWGATIGHLLFILFLVVVAVGIARSVWFALSAGRLVPLALAVGVVAYPFLSSAVAATSYWIDGRYGLYLPFMIVPLLTLVFAGRDQRSHASIGGHAKTRGSAQVGVLVGASLALVGAMMLTAGSSRAGGVPTSPTTFFSAWGDPNESMDQVVDAMEAHHITDAFGDYWTAYDLEFIGNGRVSVSPSRLDVDRWPALAAKVEDSPDPAWLFFAPGKTAAANATFSNPQPGPGDYTEQTFEQRLTQLSIPYRVVHLGVLDAVVPSRRVVEP